MEIFIKILYFLIAAPVIFLLVRYILLKNRTARVFIIFFHAFVLTFLTIFLFNKPFWRWSDQIGFIRDFSGYGEKKDAYQYMWNHFLLVDNSFDKELVLNPEGDEDDSTTLIVTNRRKLSAFLHLLNNNIGKIDLVVMDIGFELETATDSMLMRELSGLYAADKLLLSVNPGSVKNRVLDFNANVYGNIVDQGNEKLFISHTIKNDQYYSLPYKLYAHLNKIKTSEPFLFQSLLRETDSSGQRVQTASNTFFPDFYLTDEELLKGRIRGKHNSLSIDLDDGYESENHVFYYLSEPLSPSGSDEFVKNLVQRKNRSQSNIIFLGAFSSSAEDVHQTIYTDLHGPTILLNIFYALQLNRHYLTFSFVILLFIGYSIISWVLIYRSLQLDMLPKRRRKLNAGQIKAASSSTDDAGIFHKMMLQLAKYKNLVFVIRIVDFLFKFIFIEELHLVLLVALILLVRIITGQLINGMSLLIYLTVVSALLKYAKEYFAPASSTHGKLIKAV